LALIFSLSVNHRQWNCRIWCVEFSYRSLGTVDNHGNRDFCKMPSMPRFYVFTRIFCFW